MNAHDFTYWLQGFVELSDDLERPSKAQWQAIKDHLQLVFDKVTPPVGKLPGVSITPFTEPVAPVPVPTWPQPPSVDRINTPWPNIHPLTNPSPPGMMPVITC